MNKISGVFATALVCGVIAVGGAVVSTADAAPSSAAPPASNGKEVSSWTLKDTWMTVHNNTNRPLSYLDDREDRVVLPAWQSRTHMPNSMDIWLRFDKFKVPFLMGAYNHSWGYPNAFVTNIGEGGGPYYWNEFMHEGDSHKFEIADGLKVELIRTGDTDQIHFSVFFSDAPQEAK